MKRAHTTPKGRPAKRLRLLQPAKADPKPDVALPHGWTAEAFTPTKRGEIGSVTVRDATGTILGIVPIDRQGNVPEELALVRLHQIEEGDRDGKPRVPTNAGEKVDQDVLTHELVHFLRRRDPGRRGTLGQRPRPFFTSGSDRDLEEAMTDAETLARVRQAPTGRRGGYHQHIKKEGKLKAGLPADAAHDSLLVHDKQVLAGITAPRTLQEKRGSAKHYPFELAREIDIERGKQASTLPGTTKQATTAERVEESISFDTASQRDKVVARMFKGRSGRAADKAVQEHFPKLALAHLQLNGKAEAVDTYWRYRRKHATLGDLTVETHLYSPSANLDRREAIDNIVTAGMSKGNAGVAEWRDGELVQLSSKRKAGGSGGKADAGPVAVPVPTQRQLDRATAGGR